MTRAKQNQEVHEQWARDKWKEEFDEEFINTMQIWDCKQDEHNYKLEQDLKSFISKALDQQWEEIIEKLITPTIKEQEKTPDDNTTS